MKRLFPEMNDRPEKWMPAALIGYWIFAFLFIPVWLPMITAGLWGGREFNSWVDVIYHGLNAVVVVAMLRTYACDSFLEVQLFPKKFFKTVGLAVLIMLTLAMTLWWHYYGGFMWNYYPIQEMTIAATPGLMVEELPVIGIICHVVLTPISVVGLLYVPCFAPMCCRKTWLGYLVITLALMVPPALDYLWRGELEYVIVPYLLKLPMHLLACWTYQKADTVWAPLATLAIFNLGTSILVLLPL